MNPTAFQIALFLMAGVRDDSTGKWLAKVIAAEITVADIYDMWHAIRYDGLVPPRWMTMLLNGHGDLKERCKDALVDFLTDVPHEEEDLIK